MGTQKKFGQNLKKARIKANLTQEELADRAGLHKNYYARVERGEENPSYETIEKIVKSLKVKSSAVLPF